MICTRFHQRGFDNAKRQLREFRRRESFEAPYLIKVLPMLVNIVER